MTKNFLYPDSRQEILEDYRYSILETRRGFLQVLNIEEAVRHIISKKICGAFVECGTYTGGASGYALRSLLRNEPKGNRHYWGFDSFEGLPEPLDLDGENALTMMFGTAQKERAKGRLLGSNINRADYDVCESYLRATGYCASRIHLVKGWFQDTLPIYQNDIGPIAVLRLDGDFYESTRVSLKYLYDSVATHGVVIIDDYGWFEGCKKAVDEFFEFRSINANLIYVDQSIRWFLKP